MAVLEGSSNASDAVKKAVKVLEDRREKNTVASIILLSDISGQSSHTCLPRATVILTLNLTKTSPYIH
ncbi:hypothetical protein Hanom_Chr09g00858541 [Helianthus anomalus]